jgi:hypothetical protein
MVRSLTFLVGMAWLGTAGAAPLPEAAPVPPELLQARLTAAREAYALTEKALLTRTNFDAESLSRWSLRILEAQRPLCKNKDEVIAAAQEHLDRMSELEKTARKLVEVGVMPRNEMAAARYYRAEAEILLFQARGK